MKTNPYRKLVKWHHIKAWIWSGVIILISALTIASSIGILIVMHKRHEL